MPTTMLMQAMLPLGLNSEDRRRVPGPWRQLAATTRLHLPGGAAAGSNIKKGGECQRVRIEIRWSKRAPPCGKFVMGKYTRQ